MSWDFELVAGPFEFTEGPVWDGRRVIFTDIPNERVMQYDTDDGTCSVFREDTGAANGLQMGPDGFLYACERDARQIVRYDGEGSRTVVVSTFEGDRLNSPNDLYIDSRERLWFTDPDYREREDALSHSAVYRVDLTGGTDAWRAERVTFDTTRPNGLLVDLDAGRLFVAQSHFGKGNARELRSYPIDVETGEIRRDEDARLHSSDAPREVSERSHAVLHNFYPHRAIDGMCFDSAGNIVATAGWERSGPGPMIYVFDQSGRVLETHPFPPCPPTNCCFAGEQLNELYVTAYDGGLYRAETARRGRLGDPPHVRWSEQ